MQEWLNWPLSKSGKVKAFEGSNPSLSANMVLLTLVSVSILALRNAFEPDRVQTVSDSLQGNLLLKTCFQRRSFGVAERDRVPPLPFYFAKLHRITN